MSRRLTLVAAATLAFSVASARPALAQADEEPAKEWYGWQILIADASFWASVGLAFALDDAGQEDAVGVAGAVGGLSFVIAAPALHIRKDNTSSAMWSLGMRLVFPSAGALLALATNPGESGFDEIDDVMVGALIGTLIAQALDATLLSSMPSDAATSESREVTGGWAPTVMYVPSGAGLGVGGSF
jgi:hypothetical protein